MKRATLNRIIDTLALRAAWSCLPSNALFYSNTPTALEKSPFITCTFVVH